jgi:hypothetical protein
MAQIFLSIAFIITLTLSYLFCKYPDIHFPRPLFWDDEKKKFYTE